MRINNGCKNELCCRLQKMAPLVSYYRNVRTFFSKNGRLNPWELTAILLNDFNHLVGYIDCFLCNPYCEPVRTLESLLLSRDV